MSRLMIDAHGHLHQCFDPAIYFDAANQNLSAGMSKSAAATQRVIWMVDTAQQDSLTRLTERPQWGRWSWERTNERCSLRLTGEGSGSMLVLFGRQVACKEGLELLCLGGPEALPDGRPIVECLDEILTQDAVAVLPWGFGKWWFRRHSVAKSLLTRRSKNGQGRLFLGDNAGRPRGLPRPAMFAFGEQHGCLVLPGSDPLPFPSQVSSIGRYGFYLEAGPLGSQTPVSDLLNLLCDLQQSPTPFGRRESMANFCWQQVAMQLRKRSRVDSTEPI